MSKKKNKFDLTALVHDGSLKDGEMISFVSDPNKSAKVVKQPNGEYKLLAAGKIWTVHGFAQECLATEPPDHASRWFKNQKGKTLYELWHADEDAALAA